MSVVLPATIYGPALSPLNLFRSDDDYEAAQNTVLDQLEDLEEQLDAQCAAIQLAHDYYEGNQNLSFASIKFREAFGGLFNDFADNWCQLVVDAVEERLNVEGFRFGDSVEGDQKAWEIWQANNLDAESQIGHTEALIAGKAFAIVGPGVDFPEITVESPYDVTVMTDPANRRQRTAALKRWIDQDGYGNATVYRPDGIWKFRTDAVVQQWSARKRWVPRPGDAYAVNPLQEVPVIPLVNRPRMDGEGESELVRVIPIQDAVNKLVADMLVASEFGAYRQRWATGMEIPTDPATGQPVEPFKAAIDRLWIARPATSALGEPTQEPRFGEFSETNLTNYVAAIEMHVQHIASQSRTPPHYFYLKGQMPSGESIKSAETGLVAKTRRKMRHFGEAWEEVIRLAFRLQGDPRADDFAAETIWGDPEYRTEGEHTDAVLKKQALGVPIFQLWSDIGYSPQQIERFKQMLRDQSRLEEELGIPIVGGINDQMLQNPYFKRRVAAEPYPGGLPPGDVPGTAAAGGMPPPPAPPGR